MSEQAPSRERPRTDLAKRVIVGLDVEQGQVVKCIRFRDATVIGDPAELGGLYAREGADELVYLDIAASVDNRRKMLDWISRTAERVFIPFTVVGGVRELGDFRDILLAGADKVGLNTGAVADPNLLRRAADSFGSQCVVLTLDAKQPDPCDESFYEVFTHSGRHGTGLDAIEWAKTAEMLGAGEIIYTCIDRDGTREGFDLHLTRLLAQAVSIPVVASGGAGSARHVAEALGDGGADAALIASLVHYGDTTVSHLKQELAALGLSVRR